MNSIESDAMYTLSSPHKTRWARVLGLFFLILLLWSAGPAMGQGGERGRALVSAEADIEKLEDPRTLVREGKRLLKSGKRDLAQQCFEAAVKGMEINHYTKFAKAPYGKALVQEWMGNLEESRKLWRERIQKDVAVTYHHLTMFSQDPQKEVLLGEARAHIKDLVAKVKAGEEALVYVNKRGKKRFLKQVTNEEALESFKEGKRLHYVYIDELDLSEQTFEQRVGCSRCIVGSIKAYGSHFQEQFDFARGIVLGDAHLGKKWRGKANKSSFIAAGRFQRLYLNNAVVLGNLNMDSVKIEGRVSNLPMAIVDGDADLRNTTFDGNAEFRFAYFGGSFNAKGAEFNQSSYFGHARFGDLDFSRVVARKHPLYFNSAEFAGGFLFERCELLRGATFEDASFAENATMRQCRVYDRLNFSRSRFSKGLVFSQVQATNLDFLGTTVGGDADFSDSVFSGNVRFALDGLTRRLNLKNPDPLHKLYKQYQGDDDAEQDLTSKSQYGVTHVNDLTGRFEGDVSFANAIFEKFVNFEGVSFGKEGAGQEASFYNAQFYGEAHFERTRFYADADFRTIFGNEVSFNNARLYEDFLLDDANIPGRLTLSGTTMVGDARISFYGAQIVAFGVTFKQLLDDAKKHRLFYEQCWLSKESTGLQPYLDDPRLLDARWDAVNERTIENKAEIEKRALEICADRAIAEFVGLKKSFSKRGMSAENDWAYWHLRHYKNRRGLWFAESMIDKGRFVGEMVLFEMGFGWGVRLTNLLGTAFVVVLFFMVLLRILCGDMLVDWDNETIKFRDLPWYVMFIVSFHSFLGRARDWKSKSSPFAWKLIYTLEIIVGIILITFFIGAYTRMVLR